MAKALGLSEEIPSTPTSLQDMQQEFKPLLSAQESISPAVKPEEPIVSAAPTPSGYDNSIYRIVKQLAVEKKNPTPEQLSMLFRLMAFDSPYGELKDEAMAIWRTMREKGIRATQAGYDALFKVLSFFLGCRVEGLMASWRWLAEIR